MQEFIKTNTFKSLNIGFSLDEGKNYSSSPQLHLFFIRDPKSLRSIRLIRKRKKPVMDESDCYGQRWTRIHGHRKYSHR
jgi:hypothetical protein